MHRVLSMAFVLSLLLLPANAWSQSVTELGRQANEALRSGDFDSAIALYEQALSSARAGGIPRLHYNKAIAHYRKNELTEARDLFVRVVASDDRLAARARYNVGNVDYQTAVQIAQQDPQAAIARLKSAISHFRGSLAVNSGDKDARANIELASRLIRQLREQDQQEQQQQDTEQSSPSNEQQEGSDSNQSDPSGSDENKEAGEDDSESEDQEPQPQQGNPDEEQEEQQDQQQQSQQPSEESESEQQDSEGSQEGEESESEQGQTESNQQEVNNDRQQSAASQQQQNSQQDQQQEEEPEPGELDNGDPPPEGELRSLNEEDEGQDSAAMQQQDVKMRQKMTMQEARKMLQAVRDRDLRRRLDKLQRMRMRRIPVEKDW